MENVLVMGKCYMQMVEFMKEIGLMTWSQVKAFVNGKTAYSMRESGNLVCDQETGKWFMLTEILMRVTGRMIKEMDMVF